MYRGLTAVSRNLAQLAILLHRDRSGSRGQAAGCRSAGIFNQKMNCKHALGAT